MSAPDPTLEAIELLDAQVIEGVTLAAGTNLVAGKLPANRGLVVAVQANGGAPPRRTGFGRSTSNYHARIEVRVAGEKLDQNTPRLIARGITRFFASLPKDQRPAGTWWIEPTMSEPIAESPTDSGQHVYLVTFAVHFQA